MTASAQLDYIHNYTDAHVTGDEEDDQLFLDWTQAGPDDDQADEELLHLMMTALGKPKVPAWKAPPTSCWV